MLPHIAQLDVFGDFFSQAFADALDFGKAFHRGGGIFFDQRPQVFGEFLDHPGAARVGVDAENVGARNFERGRHLVENAGDFLVGDHGSILR